MRGKRRSGGGDEPDNMPTECRAPSYHIVQACNLIGFKNVLDVRWEPASALRAGNYNRCPVCQRGRVPHQVLYEFTMLSGTLVRLYLTQCRDCLTMYWME